jgi:hypothetical protein
MSDVSGLGEQSNSSAYSYQTATANKRRRRTSEIEASLNRTQGLTPAKLSGIRTNADRSHP